MMNLVCYKLTKILDTYTGRNAWLNGRLLNAGQRLLKFRFPNIGGLQDVTKQDTLF